MPRKKKKIKVGVAKPKKLDKEFLGKIFLYSIVIGIVITMATGVYSAPNTIFGANIWGYPFCWLTQPVLVPNYQVQKSVIWSGLFLNVAFWTFISFLVLIIVYRKK